MLKATSVPQTNHSQYSSPVEAFNLIVDSKSQLVELDNSTIELHVPSRRKKSLRSYCPVDFDFLAFILQFEMTFDVALRDDSSFGKLTILVPRAYDPSGLRQESRGSGSNHFGHAP